MNLDEYQNKALATAVYPGQGTLQGVLYATIGLAGETGEVCEKVKKLLRDKGGALDKETTHDLCKELGDALWYLAILAEELDLSLGWVAEVNLRKLADRAARDVLKGSGDAR